MAALHISPEVWGHVQLGAATPWWNGVNPIIKCHCSGQWFVVLCAHVMVCSCWRPRCPSGCTHCWSSAWASRWGERWLEVKKTHEHMLISILLLIENGLPEVVPLHHFTSLVSFPFSISKWLYVSQQPLGRLERLTASANDSEADERIQPLPQT